MNPCARYAMALALALAAAVGARADDVYKWVDAQGVTHYGSTPPAAASASRLDLPPPPAPPLAPPSAPRAGTGTGTRAAPARASVPANAVPMSDAMRVQQCAFARLQVETLQRGGPVYRLDEQGQRTFLPDDQRDAEIQRWRDRASQVCAGVQSDDATRQLRSRQAADARCATERLRLQELEAPGGRVPDADIAAQRRRAEAACGTR
jgi:hypothetical protein